MGPGVIIAQKDTMGPRRTDLEITHINKCSRKRNWKMGLNGERKRHCPGSPCAGKRCRADITQKNEEQELTWCKWELKIGSGLSEDAKKREKNEEEDERSWFDEKGNVIPQKMKGQS